MGPQAGGQVLAVADEVRLDQALDLLLDSALERLLLHNVDGGLLDGIMFIERGDRTNRAPKYPAIILTTGIANPVEVTSLKCKYDVPLRIWSQVYTSNPNAGEEDARTWAGRGWHALLRDPAQPNTPGITILPGSVLLAPGAFEPPGPGIDENTYVGRAMVNARVTATF